MSQKQKLELTWIGKENRPRLEPRILVEDSSLSHHASTRRNKDHFDNIFIQGDNLLAPPSLGARVYPGKIKLRLHRPPLQYAAGI